MKPNPQDSPLEAPATICFTFFQCRAWEPGALDCKDLGEQLETSQMLDLPQPGEPLHPQTGRVTTGCGQHLNPRHSFGPKHLSFLFNVRFSCEGPGPQPDKAVSKPGEPSLIQYHQSPNWEINWEPASSCTIWRADKGTCRGWKISSASLQKKLHLNEKQHIIRALKRLQNAAKQTGNAVMNSTHHAWDKGHP